MRTPESYIGHRLETPTGTLLLEYILAIGGCMIVYHATNLATGEEMVVKLDKHQRTLWLGPDELSHIDQMHSLMNSISEARESGDYNRAWQLVRDGFDIVQDTHYTSRIILSLCMTACDLLLDAGETDRGVEAARMALEYDPTEPYMNFIMAIHYNMNGQESEALEYCNYGIESLLSDEYKPKCIFSDEYYDTSSYYPFVFRALVTAKCDVLDKLHRNTEAEELRHGLEDIDSLAIHLQSELFGFELGRIEELTEQINRLEANDHDLR
ncbi:MAG: hypothetical protein AB7R89_03295 [Dehalococcoidia bacterium]